MRDPEAPSGAAAHYEVLAVRYGSLHARRAELFYRYESYGEPDAEVVMAYYFWLLRGDGKTILVDTGFDVAAANRRGRTCLFPPVEALRLAGVEPESVSTVVVTHFHYDHIGNLDAFPAAELVVPRRELEFWTGPLADRLHFAAHVEPAEIAKVERAVQDGRVRLTEGTEEILDGVTAVGVGGHSPGQQVTVVATAAGDVVLASDAIHFYEEYELQRPFAVIADLEEMYRAYDLIAELAAKPGAVVIPGHDPRVMDRFEPAGNGAQPHVVRVG
jgi:glyoxylase-like metal-dependent hydrolase (beta-lactamase superfamily II)